jgi:hypothetical protein
MQVPHHVNGCKTFPVDTQEETAGDSIKIITARVIGALSRIPLKTLSIQVWLTAQASFKLA